AGEEARQACLAAACIRPAGRAEGASRRDSAPGAGRPPRGLGRDGTEADRQERRALALPARLARHGRGGRLAARRAGAAQADRRRPAGRAALGDRPQERAGRAHGAAAGRAREPMIRSLLRRSRTQAGYTLVEMLTVMVILGVVMGALTTVFV